MADPTKLRKGVQIKVYDALTGETLVGKFTGILPPKDRPRYRAERFPRLVVRTENLIAYVPLIRGTEVKYNRRKADQ